ncbi:MAG: hypothetical protein EHM42_06100 [Planctomycetaceae bacterium]|nr:MAG: hypothetical protein EHM42_06100 [Planctomycetaceae bacterium]
MFHPGALQENFSAEVRLELKIHGQILPLAKTGPGYGFLKQKIDLEAGAGVLSMVIDGRIYEWDVFVKPGTTPMDGKVHFHVARSNKVDQWPTIAPLAPD